MIKWSSGQKQKYVFSQTLFCAWRSCQIFQKQTEDGKTKWQTFNCPLLTKNYWESMENQLSSSEMFPHDSHHCRFLRETRMICKNGTLNLIHLESELSSCQCSMTSIGHEKETMIFVFRLQKKSRCTRRDSRRDFGRSWVLETNGSGMESANINLKESGIP